MTSAINPNNIDGQYPVAGQDNNSQGFRDNFTNTKTNFQYARDEITELQNNAVLKSALTGGTLNNNMGNAIISNAQLIGQTTNVIPLGNVANSTANVVFGAGSYQVATTTGNTSLSFSGWPANGLYATVRLQLTTTAANADITVPASISSNTNASYTSFQYIKGVDIANSLITIDNTGTYVFEFSTADGGANVFIQDLTRGANATPAP